MTTKREEVRTAIVKQAGLLNDGMYEGECTIGLVDVLKAVEATLAHGVDHNLILARVASKWRLGFPYDEQPDELVDFLHGLLVKKEGV